MAKCGMTNISGGGGVGSDELTVTKDYVLSGKTYVGVDTDDEKGTGAMADNGATANQSLNCGGAFTVKKGYHDQNFNVTANNLASQTPGNATSPTILSGYEAWVNGSKVPGTMPVQNADVSGTDRAWATNVSCWESAVCLGIRNAHYISGVNWIQGAIPNFTASNIKKGINIGGLVGTWEGWVPTATDLYLRGNNIKGWTDTLIGKVSFDSGQITLLYNKCWLEANLNLTGFNRLNVEGNTVNGSGILKVLRLYLRTGSGSYNQIGYMDLRNDGAGNYLYSFDLSTAQVSGGIIIAFEYIVGVVYHIWLS